MFNSIIINKFFKLLDHIDTGSISVTTPDGKNHSFSGSKKGAHGNIVIHDWRTIAMFAARGDIGLTEAYRDGFWDTDDLCSLLLVGLQNENTLAHYIRGGTLSNIISYLSYSFQKNTLKGSKRNIQAHYDLGNDFYSLWLDPTMTYSAALYKNENETLIQAQHNKYDRILDRLEKPSGSVLEVGCGWGGFADRALARNDNDYDIKGITLSKEQHAYAKKQVQDNAHIALEDYRHQQGQYDHLVSIEMFEAVGEKFWPTYFDKMKTLLNHDGTAMIQTITIDDKHFERYRKGGDMIRSFIFPGGMLPSPERFVTNAEKSGLQVTDQFAFGEDYARTCKEWLQNFNTKHTEIKQLGFDDQFIRVWQFYLACCYAAFDVGRINVMHMELRHAA